jgi:hypothetical protein
MESGPWGTSFAVRLPLVIETQNGV